MVFWDVLDIEVTKDESKIKRAYSKKLKVYHPEVDPVGYQKLREEYDKAIKYARSEKNINKEETNFKIDIDENIKVDTLLNFEKHKEDELLKRNRPIYINNTEDKNLLYILKIKKIYENYNDRINVEKWKELLSEDLVWDVSNKEKINDLILNFFKKNRYIPKEVWILLDSYFYWSNIEINDEDEYNKNKNILIYIKKQISMKKSPNYNLKSFDENFQMDKYLKLREIAGYAFEEDNQESAINIIEKAKKMNIEDLDLIFLECKICMRNEIFAKAFHLVEKILEINPNDTEAITYKAIIYYELDEVKKCLIEFRKVYTNNFRKKEIYINIAKKYMNINHYDKVILFAIKAMKYSISRNDAKILISQANSKYRQLLEKKILKDPSPENMEKLNNLKFGRYDYLNKKDSTFKKYLKIVIIMFILFFMLPMALTNILGFAVYSFIAYKSLSILKKISNQN